MLEREMEDLIAAYPDDFFPDRGFKLKGRQQSFASVGRFDLLFEDRFQTNILMELKSVPAKYDVADQLARYKDELRNRGETHVLMWLVAPQVPNSVREFLDRIGIEYTEIHIAEFRRVADRHGVTIKTEAPVAFQDGEASTSSSPPARRLRRSRIMSNCLDFIRHFIHQVWIHEPRWVTRDELAGQILQQPWAIEKLDGEGVSIESDRLKRAGNWVDFFSAYYAQGQYGLKEEFEQQEIRGKWAYRPRQAG